MKTKILLGLLLMLVIISCKQSVDPYQGLIKKNDTCYLAIEGKIIPVDSGVTYSDATNAYKHSGKLCSMRETTKELNLITVMRYDLYAYYDGTKISTMITIDKKDTTAGMVLFVIIELIIIVVVVIFIKLINLRRKNNECSKNQ
jgi:uncharacterized membrane protein